MYSLGSVKTAIKHPRLAGRELNRLVYTRGKRHTENPNGTGIFDEDWDNLIILDACRYDYYFEMADFEGELGSRQSLGGATYEFIPANFAGRELHDTVIVSPNPQYTKNIDVIDVYDLVDIHDIGLDPSDYVEGKDIAKPQTVTQIAKQIEQRYPNKRLIIHYLQPHRPYIGPTGLDCFDNDNTWWEVEEEIVKKAYRENLELVLREVDRLLPDLVGKTVITSDHGEMLGERYKYFPMKDYGHWDGIYDKRLTTVPWHTIPHDDRKTINAEPPRGSYGNGDVQKRLELLGYG